MKRICYQCDIEKDIESFVRDKRKPEGYGYLCKQCHRENTNQRNRRRSEMKRKIKLQHIRTHMMADEVFELLYNSDELKEFIQTCAIRHAKRDIEAQKDLQQIAWAHIAMCESGKTNDYYKRIAQRAIYNEYNKNSLRREYKLSDDELMTKWEYGMWQRGHY